MHTIIFALALTWTYCASGHAPPTRIVDGPLRVRGNALLDRNGFNVELAGTNVPESIAIQPNNDLLFKVIRRRWNLNTIRLPVSVNTWLAEGDAYITRVTQAVQRANDAKLAVVLVANEDAGLPSPTMLRFWRTWAERFKTNDRIIFDVFDSPSPVGIRGSSGARRDAVEWEVWLSGGTTTDGRTVSGMQQLVETIRSTGANQVIAVQAFSDKFGFEGLESSFLLRDQNVIYEVHPYFDRASTNAQRDNMFGFLAGRVHVYAGEWGLPLHQDTDACRAIPRDVAGATRMFWEMYGYFAERKMSWTASSFEAGSLVSDYETYAHTNLERIWTCGDKSSSTQGMGGLLLLAMTGDPTGFGELAPEFIANAATGLVGDIAPGEIIAIYGVEIGPDPGVQPQVDEAGRLPTSAGSVHVTFDGVAAPIFFASAYQVNVQVPYSVAGRAITQAQLVYDGLPSTPIRLRVAEASPGIFADFSKEAKAFNQDGTLNSQSSPALRGSIIVLFGTGAGAFSPARSEGHRAVAPLGAPVLPVSVRIGSNPTEVLYAGEAPGLIGVIQLNVRVPIGPSGQRAVTLPVEMSVGSHSNMPPISIWVR